MLRPGTPYLLLLYLPLLVWQLKLRTSPHTYQKSIEAGSTLR